MSTGREAAVLPREWLRTENGYNYVQKFVKYKISATYKGADLTIILPYILLDATESPDEYLQEIVHDFLIFILLFTDTKLAGHPVLTAQFYSGKYRYFLDALWTRYLWNIKDKSRIKKDNPRGYLYRRFREIVTANIGFDTFFNNTGHLFYRVGDKKECTVTDTVNVLLNETYRDYPMVSNPLQPDENGDFRITAEWLLDTARFFYCLVEERYPHQHYFAVSELVRYLATVMPWLNRPTRQRADIDLDPDSNNLNRIDSLVAPREEDESRIDRLRQTRTICPLAWQIVACWDRIECCIFAWRLQDSPLSLEAIAEKLSLQSHNQVYSLFEKTKRSLKRFCCSWPGPPLHDLAPGVAEVFVNKVQQQAKKKCDGS